MNPPNRLAVAAGISLLAHSLILALPVRKLAEPGVLVMAPPPMSVRIAEPKAPPAEIAPVTPSAIEKPAPSAVAPRRAPAPAPKREPRVIEEPPAVAEATPSVAAPPPIDMLAMIEARRERRRAVEESRRRPTVPAPQPDAATRNLQTLTGREGVGGVFQIVRKGTRTGEFAFNGWRPSARWREYYEVEARSGESIELAMVRRMIQLIRTHYSGDFRWESHRLGRVVVLSARVEDNDGLEDFLMREFFDAPVLNPR